MIPLKFYVGPYLCYAEQYSPISVNVIAYDVLPLLQAERAVTTIARLCHSSEILLVKSGNRYVCRVNSVSVKILEKVLKEVE